MSSIASGGLLSSASEALEKLLLKNSELEGDVVALKKSNEDALVLKNKIITLVS